VKLGGFFVNNKKSQSETKREKRGKTSLRNTKTRARGFGQLIQAHESGEERGERKKRLRKAVGRPGKEGGRG